jgi:hypothetical protein
MAADNLNTGIRGILWINVLTAEVTPSIELIDICSGYIGGPPE